MINLRKTNKNRRKIMVRQITILLLLLTSCKVHYTTRYRIEDLDRQGVRYYYVNTFKKKGNCISFTEYSGNKTIRNIKTLCNYKIEQ